MALRWPRLTPPIELRSSCSPTVAHAHVTDRAAIELQLYGGPGSRCRSTCDRAAALLWPSWLTPPIELRSSCSPTLAQSHAADRAARGGVEKHRDFRGAQESHLFFGAWVSWAGSVHIGLPPLRGAVPEKNLHVGCSPQVRQNPTSRSHGGAFAPCARKIRAVWYN